MKKEKARKCLILSILCFFVHACSIFLEPLAINKDNQITIGGYALGMIFWLSLIAGGIFFLFCWKIISKNISYQIWKEKKVIGVWGSFRTPAAKIIDGILLVSLVLTIAGNLLENIPEGILLAVMAIMQFTFYLHMIVNGRVYRYMTLSERKEKKSEGEKEEN